MQQRRSKRCLSYQATTEVNETLEIGQQKYKGDLTQRRGTDVPAARGSLPVHAVEHPKNSGLRDQLSPGVGGTSGVGKGQKTGSVEGVYV